MSELDQAMKLPFLDYIAWCHDHMAKASVHDVIVADMYRSGESRVFLEAMWARRYWYYKNGVNVL